MAPAVRNVTVGSFDHEPKDEALAHRGALRGRHAFGISAIASWTSGSSDCLDATASAGCS